MSSLDDIDEGFDTMAVDTGCWGPEDARSETLKDGSILYYNGVRFHSKLNPHEDAPVDEFDAAIERIYTTAIEITEFLAFRHSALSSEIASVAARLKLASAEERHTVTVMSRHECMFTIKARLPEEKCRHGRLVHRPCVTVGGSGNPKEPTFDDVFQRSMTRNPDNEIEDCDNILEVMNEHLNYVRERRLRRIQRTG